MNEIKIDMNNPGFQHDFFELEKIEQVALIKTLKKIRQLRWAGLYSDNGLNWKQSYQNRQNWVNASILSGFRKNTVPLRIDKMTFLDCSLCMWIMILHIKNKIFSLKHLQTDKKLRCLL